MYVGTLCRESLCAFVAVLTVYDTTVVAIVHVVGFFFQAEDGIRDLVRSRGLGDVYKRQTPSSRARSRRKTS